MQDKVHYTYQENINKGKTIHCYCNNCTIETKHVVIFDYKKDVDDYEEGVSVKDDYQIIKCDNCNQLSFRIDGWFSEYQDPFPGGNDGTYEELYPESDRNKRAEKKIHNLPNSLTEIYSEVINAYNHNLFILAAVGIRAILEGICKEKGIETIVNHDGKTIEASDIKLMTVGLLQNKLISQPQKEALDNLRILGNDSIHDLFEPTKKDIKNVLDIIELVLLSVYEIPNKTKQLSNIKQKKG